MQNEKAFKWDVKHVVGKKRMVIDVFPSSNEIPDHFKISINPRALLHDSHRRPRIFPVLWL